MGQETKRNYATDYCVVFDFLWRRDKDWDEAGPDDLWDFEDWRTRLKRGRRSGGTGSRWRCLPPGRKMPRGRCMADTPATGPQRNCGQNVVYVY
jgi:hypothetical protein